MSVTGSGQSLPFLLEIVPILEDQGVQYAVVGAAAAAFYGAVRASADADVLIFPGIRSIEEVEKVIRSAGFGTEMRRGDLEDPIGAVLKVSDAHGNRVDLLTGIKGMDAGARDRCVVGEFEGVKLRVIGIEDFIAMKLFAGGPQDLQDARRAYEVSRTSVKDELLERVAAGFGRQVSDQLRLLKNAPGS